MLKIILYQLFDPADVLDDAEQPVHALLLTAFKYVEDVAELVCVS